MVDRDKTTKKLVTQQKREKRAAKIARRKARHR